LGSGIGFAGASSLPIVKSGVSPAGYSFHGLFTLTPQKRDSALTKLIFCQRNAEKASNLLKRKNPCLRDFVGI
jgi:hypothetical protein